MTIKEMREGDGKMIETVQETKDRYFFTEDYSHEKHIRKHLLYLAEHEDHNRKTGAYNNIPAAYKGNNIRRIKHYIDTYTEEEKQMSEYKIFLDSMEKSIQILKKTY